MSNMKYKVGDRVRVVGKTIQHKLQIGDEVIIYDGNPIRVEHLVGYWCQKEGADNVHFVFLQDLAPIEEPAQHYIYLGRIDGKLWLAGPTELKVPNKGQYKFYSDQGKFASFEYVRFHAAVASFKQIISTLPRIEYLGQETDFQMYQAVPFEQIFTDYQVYSGNKWVDVDYSEYVMSAEVARRHVAYGISIEEPAATIQAIREATERHTTSPEAAREFLQEAGIKNDLGDIETALYSAKAIIDETNSLHNIPEDHQDPGAITDCYNNLLYGIELIQKVKAEYADLQTASLQAEKAELVEALQFLMKGVEGLPPLTAIEGVLIPHYEKAKALLSKHTK